MSVTQSQAPRSVSRGRQPFSTGRGGVGNIRQSPVVGASTDPKVVGSGPDDFSLPRGRELSSSKTGTISTGRGGVGNMRSPSRDIHCETQKRSTEEKDVIKGYINSQVDAPVSSGRGGLGNFTRSRTDSTTRGKAGVENFAAGNGSTAERHENEEYHSGDISTKSDPPPYDPQYISDGYQSTGRDGAGKIVT